MAEYIAITQARTTSTRLPNKVLLKAAGKTLLQHQIDRIKKSKKVSALIVATTVNKTDDAIVELCQSLGIEFSRGSEADVLGRFWEASQKYPKANIIRLTSDCPLLDPAVIDLAIETFEKESSDYLSTGDAFPNGISVEIFKPELLKEAFELAKESFEREHVTPYFYTRPEKFKLGKVPAPKKYPAYRFSVDTAEDFKLIDILLGRLKPDFTLDDVCREMEKDPSLIEINQNVRQKKFNE